MSCADLGKEPGVTEGCREVGCVLARARASGSLTIARAVLDEVYSRAASVVAVLSETAVTASRTAVIRSAIRHGCRLIVEALSTYGRAWPVGTASLSG